MRLAEIARSFCAVHRTATGKSVAFLKIAGEMAEWLKAHAWKACLLERVTWVRIPLSPPRSLDCREFRRYFPKRSANYAHFSRLLRDKPDRGERTDQHAAMLRRGFFSEAMRSSPTSTNATGERLTIRNRISCEPDLTSCPVGSGREGTFCRLYTPRSVSILPKVQPTVGAIVINASPRTECTIRLCPSVSLPASTKTNFESSGILSLAAPGI